MPNGRDSEGLARAIDRPVDKGVHLGFLLPERKEEGVGVLGGIRPAVCDEDIIAPERVNPPCNRKPDPLERRQSDRGWRRWGGRQSVAATRRRPCVGRVTHDIAWLRARE